MIHFLRSLASSRLAAPLFLAALLAGCAATAPAPVRDTTPPPPVAPAPAPAPAGPTAPAAAVPTQPVHIVRPGDTLRGIARQYGVPVKDLVAWNGLTDPNQIHVGQELRVGPPVDAVAQPIPIGEGVDVQPVRPPAENGALVVKLEPKGGKQPYSDEAWAMIQPRSTLPPVAPVPPVPPPVVPDVPKPAPTDPVWLWPATGQVVGTFDEATNKGLDIAGKPGDPVLAAAGGKVVYSGSGLRGYGKLVIIKHDANYLTAYAHNQQLLVKEGDSVAKGQKIAELGSTDADRPKLHFEIRKQGRPVDPMKYLPAR